MAKLTIVSENDVAEDRTRSVNAQKFFYLSSIAFLLWGGGLALLYKQQNGLGLFLLVVGGILMLYLSWNPKSWRIQENMAIGAGISSVLVYPTNYILLASLLLLLAGFFSSSWGKFSACAVARSCWGQSTIIAVGIVVVGIAKSLEPMIYFGAIMLVICVLGWIISFEKRSSNRRSV